MKRTLLDLTQSILSSMDSDEVNSISDTTESRQVAETIKTSYYNILGRFDLPKHNQLFQLTPSNEDDQPVLMYRPDGIGFIDWIKYYDEGDDTSGTSSFVHDLNLDLVASHSDIPATPSFKEVKMIPIRDFIDMVNGFNSDDTDVETFTLSTRSPATNEVNNFNFLYKTNKQPQYCAIIENYYIIFDSFDSSVDSTLQSSKTQCFGWVQPAFLMVDDFIPDLDDQQFPLLLNEAKSLAFLELKQTTHPKAEQEVKRQSSSFQKFKATVNRPTYFDALPNFGRR